MLNWEPEQQIRLSEARRKEVQQRAERAKIVEAALRGERGRVAFYAPVMARLGDQLIMIGTHLQKRYKQRVEQVCLEIRPAVNLK